MPNIRHDLPPFENVPGASTAGRAILPRIPQGEIYDAIVLDLTQASGTTVAADIEEIKVNLGGKTIIECSGAELAKLNAYMGLTANADYLTIPFSDRTAKTIVGQRIGALDTKNLHYNEFSIEVKFDGTQTGTTGLRAFAVKGGEKPENVRGVFRALVKSTLSLASAASHNVSISTGSEVGVLIRGLAFYHSNVTHFELKKDSLQIAEKMALADYEFTADEINRVSQTGLFVYDAIEDVNQGDSLKPFRNNGQPAAMQYKVTTSGSDTIEVLADLYATINTL